MQVVVLHPRYKNVNHYKMKSKTIYKRSGVVYKVMENGSITVYNKGIKRAVKSKVKPIDITPKYKDLKHISDKELKGLNDLIEKENYTTLKQRINTLANNIICSTCPGGNTAAKTLVKNEMFSRQNSN